jgi:hypothetical protein
VQRKKHRLDFQAIREVHKLLLLLLLLFLSSLETYDTVANALQRTKHRRAFQALREVHNTHISGTHTRTRA